MSPSRNGRKAHAFTLIELLVVIAIIAILAAILFPVFAKAREKARQTSCLSNEKQLAIGVLQYNQDYDETYPNGNMGFGNGGNVSYGQGWGGQIYSYVKSTSVFKCPDDATSGTQTSLDIRSNGGFAANARGRLPISYGYNRDLITHPKNGNTHSSYTLAKLTAAASTILLFECQGQQADVTNSSAGLVDGSSPGGNGISSAGNNGPKYVTGLFAGTAASAGNFAKTAVHSDGANYTFTDGHAKWMRGDAVSAGWGNTNSDCGKFNQDYASGTTTGYDGGTLNGGQAASADKMGTACNGGTAYATFSPT